MTNDQITVSRELLEQVLDAMIQADDRDGMYSYSQEITALRAALEQPAMEPVYTFRRKGLDDFCTCSKERFDELSNKPHLFETTTFYAAPKAQQPAPPADVPLLSDEEIVALVREASKGGAINRDGSTSQRIARAIEQAVRRNAGLK